MDSKPAPSLADADADAYADAARAATAPAPIAAGPCLPGAGTALPAPGPLHAWLDRCCALSPEYGAGLSTHLPMALAALHGLGAPPARLQALFERIAPGLPRRVAPPDAALHAAPPWPALHAAPPWPALHPAPPWPALLGRFEAFGTLHAALSQQAVRDGVDTLLRQALPRLMPGVAAVAFHGLIRTAHGCAAGHAGEVVTGLAYWASRHAPLAPAWPVARADPGQDLPHWLQALQALPAPPGAPARLILSRMQAWSAVPGFVGAAASLQLQDDTLPALARHAAVLYAATGNFTVLHLVTACHALQTLRPWLDDEAAALRAFSVAAAAALRASGWPALPPSARPALSLSWPAIVARAIASDDEHVIKLVHASRAFAEHGDEAVFRAAAQRAVADPP